jgi:hypothetical protein
LVELELITKVGERELDRTAGKRESIYVFRREEKPDVTQELFIYCLNDFWEKYHQSEGTLSLREVAFGQGSPGQVLKLPEQDIRVRLDALEQQTRVLFVFSESSALQQIRRNGKINSIDLLKAVYS